MNLLDGIFLYELIMIILGAVLASAGIFVLIYGVLKKETNVPLLVTIFLVAIIMIGFPAIKTIEFQEGVLKIEKEAKKLEVNPRDTIAQRALLEALQAVAPQRAEQSSAALSTVAKAQEALGNYETAAKTASQAAKLDPTSQQAQETVKSTKQKADIKKRVDVRTRQLNDAIERINKNPNNPKLQDSIALMVRQIKSEPIRVDDKTILTVARGAAILGAHEEALKVAQTLEKENAEAVKKLKEEVSKEDFKRKFPIRRQRPSPRLAPTPTPNAPVMPTIDSQKFDFQLMRKVPIIEQTQ